MEDGKSAKDRDPHLSRLDALPDEVLQAIFHQLDAISLTLISRTSKRFLHLAEGHLIWKALCLRDFTYWDSRHEIESRRLDPSFHDWKGLYAVRHQAHIAAAHTLKAIIDEPVGRLARIRRICDDGFGIKDSLLQFYEEAASTEYPLAQRYWTHTLLSCLNRSRALEIWTRVRSGSGLQHPTELALAALDMFIVGSSTAGDIDDTFRRLNGYVSAIRASHPDLDYQTPRERAVTIASFLRSKKWVGMDEGANYFSIENQFLGYALRSKHHNSLPLISCVIYSYVCRAFNLRAQPCSYPNHVHVVVQPSDPTIDLDGRPLPPDHPVIPLDIEDLDPVVHIPSELTHLYLDPFNTHQPIPLSVLASRLAFLVPGAGSARRTNYLLPSSPRALLIRTGHNVLRSINTNFPPQPSDVPLDMAISVNDAAYAALFLLVLFPSTPSSLASNLAELRQHFAGHFVEDLNNYITYVAPLTSGMGHFAGGSDPLVKLIRDEDMHAKTPKTRSTIPGGEDVKYTVGTVFRHRRQGYIGVVYGWDAKCEMNDRWILGNGVDSLSGGRRQPFYNAL